MTDKIAVVTGSNKGIGYAIVRELCLRKVGTVYLAARDVKRGEAAVATLKKEGLNPIFHQLEVTDKKSVQNFADYLKKKHGGFDILINNAAVIVENFEKTTYEDSKRVLEVNYFSILTIQEILFPLIRENGRIINISSDCGHISNIKNQGWVKKLISDDLESKDVQDFVNWFLDSVANNTLNEKDFFQTEMLAYRISKVALSALTKVQQKEIGRNISVNSIHPGFVQTDMTKGTGNFTLEESGKTPVYLALDAPQSLKGAYIWFDGKVIDWNDPTGKYYCDFTNVRSAFEAAGVL